MFKFQDLEETVKRKRTSNFLHLSLIFLCLAVGATHWFIRSNHDHKEEVFKCAVHNAGIGEWNWDKSKDLFIQDSISKAIFGRDILDLSDLIETVDKNDREKLIGLPSSNEILITCKVGDKEVLMSGVLCEDTFTGIVKMTK